MAGQRSSKTCVPCGCGSDDGRSATRGGRSRRWRFSDGQTGSQDTSLLNSSSAVKISRRAAFQIDQRIRPTSGTPSSASLASRCSTFPGCKRSIRSTACLAASPSGCSCRGAYCQRRRMLEPCLCSPFETCMHLHGGIAQGLGTCSDLETIAIAQLRASAT